MKSQWRIIRQRHLEEEPKLKDTQVAESKSKGQKLFRCVLKLGPKQAHTSDPAQRPHSLTDVFSCHACTKPHPQMAIAQVSDNFVASLKAEQNNIIKLHFLDRWIFALLF